MNCRVQINFKEYNNVPLEAQNIVRRLQFQEPLTEPSNFFYQEVVIGDLDEIGRLLALYDCSFELKNFKGNMYTGLTEKLDAAYPDMIPKPISPNVTHVHIPSLGLLLIDEVTVLEDTCTDNLQRHLNENWRILAVCPPNGTRRPDYILGRTKEK